MDFSPKSEGVTYGSESKAVVSPASAQETRDRVTPCNEPHWLVSTVPIEQDMQLYLANHNNCLAASLKPNQASHVTVSWTAATETYVAGSKIALTWM